MEATTASGPGTAVGGKPGLLSRIRAPRFAQQPDERLVALARLGNPAAFEALFWRYRPRLVRFSEHLLGASWPDAEDVVQEAMIAASGAMVADERPLDVRPWLYRITRNRCLSHLRDQAATTRPPLTGNGNDHLERVADGAASTAEHVERRETLRLLVADVRSLPETQRTAIVLRELDGLSYKEVAEVTGTTVASVKSVLVRARLGLVDIAEGRELSCDQVRISLARAEQRLGGLDGAQRAHIRGCETCAGVRKRLRATTHGLAALSPIGLAPLLGSALQGGGGATASTAGAGSTVGAVGAAAGGGGTVAAGGFLAGGGALAIKGLLVAVTAGVVAVGGYSAGSRDQGGAGPTAAVTAGAGGSLPPSAAEAADGSAGPNASSPSPDRTPPSKDPVVVAAAAPAAVELVEETPPGAPTGETPPRDREVVTDIDEPRGYPGEDPPAEPPPSEPPPPEPPPQEPPPSEPPPPEPPPQEPPPQEPPPSEPPPPEPPPQEPPPSEPPPEGGGGEPAPPSSP